MDQFGVTIIGAGVVGLALAEELSSRHADVLVVEKNTGFGQETSSRNSEVIHGGIYFPADFLRTRFCVEGNRLLYERCLARDIPHLRRGKLILAARDEELAILETLKGQAEANGVPGMTLLGGKQLRTLEPEIVAKAALFSPTTGIIDSHRLMRSFLIQAQENGAAVVFRSEVTAIHRGSPGGYDLELNGGPYRFHTRVLINSAGLHADRIAALAGLDIDRLGYRLKFCKGDYFAASPSPRLNHLVYPVPVKNNVGLGIHATPDLTGRVRFGPDDQYVADLNYDVDARKSEAFFRSVQSYLPGIGRSSLQPDMSGIRPKLQGPGEPPRDFVVQEESKAGFPGLINLIGIESPGLTGAMAIARYCAKLVAPLL
ncbi:MAG: NAD(P)/FAD-dependent oxidoreductase [Deltaproteobacteria bacterium]|nr:NAD(P)/FAD-dependent oxidoreductase [Deltaproteobacteria bacterium]